MPTPVFSTTKQLKCDKTIQCLNHVKTPSLKGIESPIDLNAKYYRLKSKKR